MYLNLISEELIRSAFYILNFYKRNQNAIWYIHTCFRIDNVCEYLSHKFQQFMTSNGIFHQTSCYFYLVHSSHTVTPFDFQYFVTFMDNYSRCT